MQKSPAGVLIFGVQVQLKHLPLWFLILTLPALPFIRESYPILWNSQSIRPLTAFTAIIFISLSVIWHWRDKVMHASPLVIGLIALFWGFHALSTALSAIPWQGSAHLLEMLLYAVTGLLLYHQLHNAPQFRALFSISLMLMLSLMTLRFLYGWVSIYDPVNHPWSIQLPFAQNIRHIGYLAAMLLPVGYSFLVMTTPKTFGYWMTLVFLVLAWGLVFWMGGRATFLALVAATAVFCLFYPRTLLAILAAAISGLLLSQLFMVTDPNLNLFRLFDLGDDQKDLNKLSSQRLTLYQQALQLWWQQSPVIGLGSDAFRYLKPSILGDHFAQPHSVVIQTLLSSGLSGGLTLVILLMLLGRAWLQNRSSQWPGLIVASMAAIATGLIDGVFYHSLSFFTFSIVLALSLPPTRATLSTSVSLPATVIAALTGSLFFILLSWQIALSRSPLPTSGQLAWIHRYPLYIDARHWIEFSDEPKAQHLAQMAAQLSDRPCLYQKHLNEDQRQDFLWCPMNAVAK